jgi:hypothetical protein
MEELKKAVDKLRDSTRRLNEATDKAGAIINEVEAMLASIGVGRYGCAIVSADHNHEHGISVYTSLVYARIAGKYRIGVEWGHSDDPESNTLKPWAECSREEKLQSFAKLPDLLEKLSAEVDQDVTSAVSTVESVSKVVAPVLLKREGK